MRGQSVVEFALILPLALFLLLGILDLGRVYSAMLTVEAAARDAADFGAYGSANWIGSADDPASNHSKTIAGMLERVCVASRHLTDYVGSGSDCSNPSFSASLVEADGSPASGCDDPEREPAPCRVRVDVEYRFDLIVPVGIDLFDVRLGLPSSVSFQRSSIFPISDFEAQTP